MREISSSELSGILEPSELNLIRRGANGSLTMSADRWRLAAVEADRVVFRSILTSPGDEGQVLEIELANVQKLTWDQLPKQRNRSQVRFHLASGDLWTFSGALNAPGAD